MKALSEKIIQESGASRKLREAAWEEPDFEKSQKIRKAQQEHWEKFNFLKELNKAIEKKGE